MRAHEKAFIAASVVDLTSTYYGIKYYGGEEANPIITAFGSSPEEVVVSGAMLTVIAYFIFKWIGHWIGGGRNEDAVFWIATMIRSVAAAWNISGIVAVS